MIDWDDVRYFLAAARGGSVRAAAKRLGVNHATVLLLFLLKHDDVDRRCQNYKQEQEAERTP